MAYAVEGATRPDSFSGMNADFSSALSRMIAEAPENVRSGLRIGSGFRSPERQSQLWNDALKKYGSAEKARKWVAPPGRSQHNHGNAADLKFLSPEARKWAHENAGKYGLSFPLSNEDWHIELAGARKGGKGMMALVDNTVERAPLPAVAGDKSDLKERAKRELLKRRAKAELERRKASPKLDPATNHPQGAPEFKPVGVDNYNPQTGEVENTGAVDKIGAFLSSAIEGVPIVGPTLKKAATGTAAGIVSTLEGENFDDVYKDMEGNTADLERDNPNTATAGYLTGAIAPMVGLGATTLGAKVLGSTGNSLGQRMLLSGASNALVSATDTAARGGSDADVARNTLISGGIGLAIPAAGAVLNSMGRYAKDSIAPRVNAIARPGYEAERRVGAALSRDADNTAAPLLTQTDEAAAALNQQQLLNVDRGGETTRALARSAANSDPEARALIEQTASDRFASQGDRARSFIDRITGGATDDLAVQEGLRSAARSVNDPAYKRAFAQPGAQDMATPELLDMLKSPAMRQAAAAAEKRGADRAVVEGFETVRNPFAFDEAGNVSMKDGVKPTLQFWNQVKINLDGEIGKAVKAGDRTLVNDLKGLKTKLTSELDKGVPEYAMARQGAAAFFGAEDALDAGKKFVTMNRQNAEVAAALKKMKPAERLSFAVGFASELKDAIAQASDRTNVINKIFGSQQSRDKIRLALGDKAFSEFEQFVKVENSMDMLRRAMGNSTTARQLMEMGLAGGAIGGGTALYTGDWTQGLTVGVLAGLAKRYSGKVDERVTKRVAELLLSDNPQALKQAVTLAKNSQKASRALDAIQTALSAALKGAGNAAVRPERKPLEITVTQPNAVESAQ